MSNEIRVVDRQISAFDTVEVSESATPTYDRDDGRLRAAYTANADDEREYVFSIYRYGDADTFSVADGAKILDYGEGVAHVLTPADAYEGEN
ncbi:hypothetical protein CK500_08385 [Halorubrum salipaludis]|uniref:Uncharacterized protein n=1 Tax=Halorubrum salipaludis TaxID=2032630 RepID=A0A2A2FG43_9EURY|nr:hypothetical protein [Halorubrum salipaludis]PAU83525.1 hypothetical protein CK500_08385 [Halorubrum salipaludis]